MSVSLEFSDVGNKTKSLELVSIFGAGSIPEVISQTIKVFYLSILTAHRWRMEQVQQVTSKAVCS